MHEGPIILPIFFLGREYTADFFPSSFWSSLAIYTANSLVCQDYEKDQISLILIGNLFSYRALCVIVIDIFAFVLRVPCTDCTQSFLIRN